MYAVIKTGGKQYKVSKGDVIDVELLSLETGNTVQFKEVLFVFDGKEHKIGEPSLSGITVKGEVLGESSGPKIKSFKYKPRKRQNKRFGHRQHYSRVKILEIGGAEAPKPKAVEAESKPKAAKPKAAAKPKTAETKPKAAAKPKTAAKPKAASKKKEAPAAKKESAPKKKKAEE